MKPKVLIVDDDPLMRVLYKSHLERGGYEMLTAKDGLDAIFIASAQNPQLIVMDLMMPGMDGLSAIREMKRSEAMKHIPILIVTSNVGTWETARKESVNAGASGFLCKPFPPDQLLKEARRLAPIPPAEKKLD